MSERGGNIGIIMFLMEGYPVFDHHDVYDSIHVLYRSAGRPPPFQIRQRDIIQQNKRMQAGWYT